MVKKQTSIRLIVEGGAGKDSHLLQTQLRKAFHILLKKAEIGRQPTIIAAGGRAQAYDKFKTLSEHGEIAILLVDSEFLVSDEYNKRPWDFLKCHESWEWMPSLNDEHCHLMVQCMETWFFADPKGLSNYYGNGFVESRLPKTPIEQLSKKNIFSALDAAAKDCKTKNGYDKGRDSFKILECLNPVLIQKNSVWAERFFTFIRRIMNS